MRTTIEIDCSSPALGKLTSEFVQVAYLSSNNAEHRSLLAFGILNDWSSRLSTTSSPGSFPELKNLLDNTDDWVFGYLSYELKNKALPEQNSGNDDFLHFPLMRFFQPEFVVEWNANRVLLHYHANHSSPQRLKEVLEILKAQDEDTTPVIAEFHPAVSETEYIRNVQKVQHHIQQGDVYELNYCIPFDAVAHDLNSAALYKSLNALTEAPFSVYYQDDTHALMCGSPERFLQKRKNRLLSQPIKGTIRRGSLDDDALLIEKLRADPKERAENIMITDLVRNDLSKVAAPETVRVDELCGIYTFKTVHQMISSISAELAPGKSAVDAIRAAFPMGSMTGAPKVRAAQIIEDVEIRQRGLYSGSFGYFEPNGDFDFNVIIRSLLYHRKSGHLSFQVGSAITSQSDPVKEYEECMLKAEALLKSTQSTGHVV
jgi:para-aminobenzoate synthetase component 1